MSDIVDTILGRDKVELDHDVRTGPISGSPKSHIHAESVAIDSLSGQTRVTEKYTGDTYVVPSDSVKKIGGAVNVDREGF